MKKWLSAFLTLVLVLGLIPGPVPPAALAAETLGLEETERSAEDEPVPSEVPESEDASAEETDPPAEAEPVPSEVPESEDASAEETDSPAEAEPDPPALLAEGDASTGTDGLWEWAAYGGGVQLTGYLGSQTDVLVPASVEADGEKYEVVRLGDGLFQDSAVLNSATLGEGIREIGDNAFAGCTNLVSVVMPQSLETIGDSAFSGCAAFNSVILYDGVTSIGAGAFEGGTGLTIYCYKDSAAHRYAVENEIDYIVMDPGGEPEIFEEDGITYYIMNGAAVAVASDPKKIGTEVEIPEKVNGYPVTELRGTFKGNENLKSVHLPDSVTTIGDEVFYACTYLESVNIPSNVTTIGDHAFYYCDILTEIDIPDNVVTVGEGAFEWCNGLTRVVLPAINTIGYEMFRACDKLEEVVFSEGTVAIEGYAFDACYELKSVTLPDSLRRIEGSAFRYCVNLQNIVIPNNVEKIGEWVFDKCDSLRYLLIPSSVQTIFSDSLADNIVWVVTEGSKAHTCAAENNRLYVVWDEVHEPEFYDVEGITYCIANDSATAISSDTETLPEKVVLPEAVEDYPVTGLRGTFKGNETLKSVTLPASVTIIGDETFEACSNMESVNIPKGVTTIGENAFSFCCSLTEIHIPDSVVTIGDDAFLGCSSLTSVVMPAINTIGYRIFGGCAKLEEVVISEGTTVIGASAFSECENLRTVTLPSSLTLIDFEAFSGCTRLRYLLIPASVQSISSGSLADSTVWVVTEGSEAHKCAAENNKLYVLWDGVHEPIFYDVADITYCVINDSAMAVFSDKEKLPENVVIPETVKDYTVTELRGTFKRNSTLKTVTLPASVTVIGDETFQNCYSLESVNIPSGVTTIGNWTFSSCNKLTQITIPDSVTTIGSYAFSSCSSLTQIDIPDSVVTIGSTAFGGCDGLTRVALPPINDLEYETFCGCRNLQEVLLSEGTTAIWSHVFEGCDNLRAVTLPNSLTTIWENAFALCPNLRQLVIPPSVEYIFKDSLSDSIIWIVTENSPAHKCAVDNNRLYFVLPETLNPEISYGTEITGTVTNTSGAPVSNAAVEILYADGTLKEQVQTKADGTYAFTYAEVGRYTIRATDANGNTQSTTASVKRMNAFDVFLAGDTNLVLKQGYTVSGTVSPKTSATVTLTDLEGRVIASTESSGSYRLEDIPNGSYLLKAENESGSVLREIRVYNDDLTEDLTIDTAAASAAVSGIVKTVERDNTQSPAVWAQVSLYNSQGVLTAQVRSDGDGRFSCGNLPLDHYAIVAETTQMRPDKEGGYLRSHTLTGYGYLSVTENQPYDAGTILLYEESGSTGGFSGKVTANGQTQDCTVTLTNAFRFEVAVTTTGRNGKYTFKNIPDGLYFVTAVTSKLGMGTAVVVVRGGAVYGETNIRVYKNSRVAALEEDSRLPEIQETAAKEHREDIAEEKERYDSLSDKERQQLDQEYLKRLNTLAEAAVDYSVEAPLALENGGTLISKEEIANGSRVALALTVEELPAHTISGDGIKTEQDYVQQMMEDAAGKGEIAGYYDIALTKNGQEITDISKQTDTAGKLRITMDIPQEARGHAHYSMVHVHNGEPAALADLDENPDTITFELDRFSACALTYSDVLLTETDPLILSPDEVTLTLGESGTVEVTVEEGVIADIRAVPEDPSVVTANVAGSQITLTSGAAGKTTVAVTVQLEGSGEPLTGTVSVEVLASGASVSLSVDAGQAVAAVSGSRSGEAVLYTAAYRADGKLLAAASQALTLTAGQAQRIPVSLSTEGAASLKAFLTDGTRPLAESASISVSR